MAVTFVLKTFYISAESWLKLASVLDYTFSLLEGAAMLSLFEESSSRLRTQTMASRRNTGAWAVWSSLDHISSHMHK